MIPPILLFLLILSFLVFIHELGHFLTARKFGVKVEEFGLGIPPRAWGKKIGETIYSLNWLPIGGFVRIKGEDFENHDPKDKTSFINKKPWQKSVILLAGVFMNFVLAVVLFYFVLSANGWKSNPLILLDDYEFRYGVPEKISSIVMFIEEGSPAEEGGINFGDVILSLTYGEETALINDVGDIRAFLADKSEDEILVTTENINTGEANVYTVIPRYSEAIDQLALGISTGEGVRLTYTESNDKIFAGFKHSANIVGYSFYMIGALFSASIETGDITPVAQGVSGPVGIFGAVRAVLENGGDRVFITMLDLTAILSLSLALMNLLPIPALDGGRWVFVLYEWVVGKPASPYVEARAHQAGFAFLILLIVLITFKDIFQFIV